MKLVSVEILKLDNITKVVVKLINTIDYLGSVVLRPFSFINI